MKQLEVQIMGQSYLLGCPEGGDASLLDAVNRVDLAMCKIRDAGKVKARDRIAVLAALNLAFEAQAQAAAQAVAMSVAATSAEAKAEALAQAQAASALAHDPASAITASESARLLALIERMDAVLGEDGQLI